MSNSSEKNAACGPYIAPCSTSPMVVPSTIVPNDFVSSIAKNTNDHTAMAIAPNR